MPILGSDLASFAVLGATPNVTNTGATTLTGYVGVSPAASITAAIAAQGQLTTARLNLESLASLAGCFVRTKSPDQSRGRL